jgi:lipid II:glycine glycyltransferase (peptidoglycan interpeptide bridge formation enzyme)
VPGKPALRDLESAYGYGGPIVDSADPSFAARAWRRFGEWAAGENVMVEFLRFHPLLENHLAYPGETTVIRRHVYLDLAPPDLLASYSGRARTAVKKAAANGVTVEWVPPSPGHIDDFVRLYEGAMAALKADDFYYFPREFFRELFAWDGAALALARLNGQPVAASIFLGSGEQMEYYLSGANAEGKKAMATNAILHAAALRGQAEGRRWLHLGGGTSGRDDDPLLFFKRSFSPLLADFRIGKRVYREGEYAELKGEWERRRGEKAKRVLFYRE